MLSEVEINIIKSENYIKSIILYCDEWILQKCYKIYAILSLIKWFIIHKCISVLYMTKF